MSSASASSAATKLLQIQFDQSQKLGSGTFGVVFKGTFQGIEVAVKRIPLDKVEPTRDEEAMARLDHPNVVKLYCIEQEPNFK